MKGRLKEEFVGRPGQEIGKLRKQGVEVTSQHEEPLFCFMGDTTAAVFDAYTDLCGQHKIVVVECSFIDDQSLERAETTKHMHWNHLRPIVEAHPNTFFVLTHFSLKYSALTLRRFFREQQQSYKNIHPMLIEEEIIEEWNKREQPETSLPTCHCRRCQPPLP